MIFATKGQIYYPGFFIRPLHNCVFAASFVINFLFLRHKIKNLPILNTHFLFTIN